MRCSKPFCSGSVAGPCSNRSLGQFQLLHSSVSAGLYWFCTWPVEHNPFLESIPIQTKLWPCPEVGEFHLSCHGVQPERGWNKPWDVGEHFYLPSFPVLIMGMVPKLLPFSWTCATGEGHKIVSLGCYRVKTARESIFWIPTLPFYSFYLMLPLVGELFSWNSTLL